MPSGQKLVVQSDPDWWQVDLINGGTVTDKSWMGERWHQQAPEDTTGIPFTFTGSGTSGATSIRVVIPQLFWTAL